MAFFRRLKHGEDPRTMIDCRTNHEGRTYPIGKLERRVDDLSLFGWIAMYASAALMMIGIAALAMWMFT